MNKKGYLLVVALLVSLAFLARPWTLKSFGQGLKAESSRKGLFTVVEGNVKKKQVQDPDWIRAQVKTDVLGGDRVRTLLQSRAEMQLAQLDFIRLAPQTTIDIVKLYEETKEKKIATQIKVKEGDIWGKVKSVDANSSFEVSSDFAGAAITGTIFRVHHDSVNQETQLKVYTGEVKVSNVPEKMETLTPKTIQPYRIPGPVQVPGPREITMEEWVYLVRSYQQITVGAQGQVKSMGAFKKTDRDENSDWVKWNLQRDRLR
ncbi:MAG: FecR family protein [candidate division KSB1 bacterium]|nr:FecR family protein [candidate division KSB1 bacterium]